MHFNILISAILAPLAAAQVSTTMAPRTATATSSASGHVVTMFAIDNSDDAHLAGSYMSTCADNQDTTVLIASCASGSNTMLCGTSAPVSVFRSPSTFPSPRQGN
jgi:hypothetical protein